MPFSWFSVLYLVEYVLWMVEEGGGVVFLTWWFLVQYWKVVEANLANRKFVKKLRIKINKSISWIVKNPGFFFWFCASGECLKMAAKRRTKLTFSKHASSPLCAFFPKPTTFINISMYIFCPIKIFTITNSPVYTCCSAMTVVLEHSYNNCQVFLAKAKG